MMRVLQFGRFGNPSRGGIERHVANLSSHLAEAGVDVVNLVSSQDRRSGSALVDGYRLTEAASYGIVFSTPVSPGLLSQAYLLHARNPFDIVHLHFPDPLSHAASMLFPASVKRVITWHSDIVKQQRLLKLYAPFQRAILRRADAVIAGTQAHFASSTQIAIEEIARPVVIPYGLDYSALEYTAPVAEHAADLKKKTGKPLIFALGRHVYYKGFSVLIEAMRKIDGHLMLGGEGPLSAELHAQCRHLGLQEKITFLGRVPDAELAWYMHACDVFCLPSIEPSEAFGLVQLEAMACGKPVVCTRLGNGVNVVNQEDVTGLAVPANDPDALAATLNRLLAHEQLRARLGAAGRERALNVYSAKSMAEQHLRLYEDLLR